MQKAELIIHPVRFRILQALGRDSLTTQEIAERLPDVPKSSIYRHLKLLLKGEMVAIAETRLVNGIQEKTYVLQQRPYLGPEDMASVTAAEHISYFTSYVMTLVQDFAAYVAGPDEADADRIVDMVADRAGYTEVSLYATQMELDVFHAALNTALSPLLENGPGNGRHRHKIALITHPQTQP